jgi:hypothetical protein
MPHRIAFVGTLVAMATYTHTLLHTHLYNKKYILHTHTYICIYAHTCTLTRIHTQTHTYTYTYTHILSSRRHGHWVPIIMHHSSAIQMHPWTSWPSMFGRWVSRVGVWVGARSKTAGCDAQVGVAQNRLQTWTDGRGKDARPWQSNTWRCWTGNVWWTDLYRKGGWVRLIYTHSAKAVLKYLNN